MNHFSRPFRVWPKTCPQAPGLLAMVLLCGLATGCSWLRTAWTDPVLESRRLAEQAHQAEDRGEIERAADLLSRAARENPRDAEIHRHLARLLFEQGDSDAAVEQLRYAVAQNPHDLCGLVQLAGVFVEQDEYAQAKHTLETALDVDPGHTEALLLRGRLAERQHRDGLALEIYHRVLGSDSEHVEARLRIAAIQLRSDRPERAAPLLRWICQSSQINREQQALARWQLGIAYGHKRRWTDAARELAIAIEDRENVTADDWYRLAHAQQMAGDLQNTWSSLGAALELQPHHEEALDLTSALAQSAGNIRSPGPQVATRGTDEDVAPRDPSW